MDPKNIEGIKNSRCNPVHGLAHEVADLFLVNERIAEIKPNGVDNEEEKESSKISDHLLRVRGFALVDFSIFWSLLAKFLIVGSDFNPKTCFFVPFHDL